MTQFQQILLVQHQSVSDYEVDLEVYPSPDWKPVELGTNSSGYVAKLGDDCGGDEGDLNARRQDDADDLHVTLSKEEVKDVPDVGWNTTSISKLRV
jgi:hypothetical protein